MKVAAIEEFELTPIRGTSHSSASRTGNGHNLPAVDSAFDALDQATAAQGYAKPSSLEGRATQWSQFCTKVKELANRAKSAFATKMHELFGTKSNSAPSAVELEMRPMGKAARFTADNLEKPISDLTGEPGKAYYVFHAVNQQGELVTFELYLAGDESKALYYNNQTGKSGTLEKSEDDFLDILIGESAEFRPFNPETGRYMELDSYARLADVVRRPAASSANESDIELQTF